MQKVLTFLYGQRELFEIDEEIEKLIKDGHEIISISHDSISESWDNPRGSGSFHQCSAIIIYK